MLIIDAYNLLNVEGVLPAHLAGLDLVELVGLLGRSRHAGERILVVCDGHLSRLAGRLPSTSGDPVRVQFGGVEMVFSAPGSEADDVIEALLAHHAGSNSLIVVSSDRRLARAARRVGGRAVASAAFMRQLAVDADRKPKAEIPAFARKTPLDRGALAFWMAEFGLGEPGETAPEPPRVEEVQPVEPEPASTDGTSEAQVAQLDDFLLRLIRESRVSIDPVDLDMERWLREHPPESSSR